MSNILFLTNWPYNTRFQENYYGSHSYFEGFKNALLDVRHNVLQINLLNFKGADELDKKNSSIYNSLVIEKIKSFNPDLIIAFNNQITKNIYNITNCPVLVWWCDEPSYFDYCGNQYVEEYKERVYFFVNNEHEFEYVESRYKLNKDRIFLIKPSTAFYKQDVKQDKDITYVGYVYQVPRFLDLNMIRAFQSNRHEFREACDRLQYDVNDKIGNDFLTPIFQKQLNKTEVSEDILIFCLFKQKTQFLISLASFFDLHIYSSGDYYRNFVFPNMQNIDLMIANHIDEPCTDIKDVCNIYNSSKISINLSTANANKGNKSSFSWRVCDVMATNSCLVSNISSGLDRHFDKWVKIPQFSTKQEAYDLVQKLLENENFRKDIVAESQLAIKEGGFTFSHRVQELESLFNLKSNENNNEYEFFVHPKFKIDSNIKSKSRELRKKIKMNIKMLRNKFNIAASMKMIVKKILCKFHS